MPRPFADLTARTFGTLRPLRRTDRVSGRQHYWLCLCDPDLGGCGAEAEIRYASLTGDRVTSCGCVNDVLFAALPDDVRVWATTERVRLKLSPFDFARRLIERAYRER